MNQVVYSPKALSDLDEIFAYISDKLANPVAAESTINGILDTADMLKEHSEIGKPLYFSDDIFSGYRYLIYKNYLVFYRSSNDTAYIDRILYGKRDYINLFIKDLTEDNEQ